MLLLSPAPLAGIALGTTLAWCAVAPQAPGSGERCQHLAQALPRVAELARLADGRELSFRFRRLRFDERHPEGSGGFRYLREGVITLRFGLDALWTRESYWQWEGSEEGAPVHQERTVRLDLMTGEAALLLARMDDPTPLALIEAWTTPPALFAQSLGYLGFDAPPGPSEHDHDADGALRCRIASPDGTLSYVVEWSPSPPRLARVYASSSRAPAARLACFLRAETDDEAGAEPTWIVHVERGADGAVGAVAIYQRLAPLAPVAWSEEVPVGSSVMDLRVPGRKVDAVRTDRPVALARLSTWLPRE